MNKDSNSLNWFEIPVIDMERARHFYQVAFGIHMDTMNMSGIEMAFFPMEMGSGKANGALAMGEAYKPCTDGSLIYLNANPDMANVLQRIEIEGGKILKGKTLITPEIGYMALFIDTEGNRVALHSRE